MPDQEYSRFSRDVLDALLTKWENMFEDLFGLQNMVYNVHLWVSMAVRDDQARERHSCLAIN